LKMAEEKKKPASPRGGRKLRLYEKGVVNQGRKRS